MNHSKHSNSVLLTAAALTAAFAMTAAAQPEISFDSVPNFLKLPERIYLGEAAGVATTSKGHIVVFTRTGDAYATIGTSRTFTHGGARLFEFDQNGTFVREIGQGLYGFLWAESVKVDPQDNIWVVDRGSSLVIKFDPEGRVAMVMGRKPEAITVGTPGRGAGAGGGRGAGAGAGRGAEAGAAAGRRLGHCWRYFRRRRLSKFTHRQVRQERALDQVVGVEGHGAGAVRHSTFDRARCAGERVRRRHGQQAHSGVR
jgi:hypothetical protein